MNGGANLFVDGKSLLCQPVRQNPIVLDRSKATVELTEGEHEIVVAFDTDAGNGWGIRFRFSVPDGGRRIQAAFAIPVSDP